MRNPTEVQDDPVSMCSPALSAAIIGRSPWGNRGSAIARPLRPRLRRIGRRRLGTRPRILTRLLLQPLQTIPVLLDLARQLENELDTRLAPRVIDRLRLSTVHARKIRCTNKESLPMAPTTERLRFLSGLGRRVAGE